MDEKPKRRRWFRFSLRTFLVAVTLCAIWIGVQTNRARKQQRAVEALTHLRTQISYDWQYNEQNPTQSIPNAKPPGPDWLRKAIGDHYFQNVARLYFQETRTKDSDLKWLESLPDVRFLSLCHSPVTDDGMKYVATLSNLEILDIFHTKVGDAGVEHLRDLTNLREIQCRSTLITDDGLAYLSSLANLERLFISETQ